MLQPCLGFLRPQPGLPLEMPKGAFINRQKKVDWQSLGGPCALGEGMMPARSSAEKGSRS